MIRLKKYWAVFRISLKQEFAYKINFVMWRLRNVLQLFVLFYFWNTLFSGSDSVIFGYDKSKILTYSFAILFVRALVMSARAVDVPNQIANGDLSNLLVKPVGFFRYWFSRDLSSKLLNLIFAFVEVSVLAIILRPPLFIQTNLLNLFGFLVSIILAITLFYLILFVVNTVAFWMPENGWAVQFLFITIITEFFAGGFFPLDIFPQIFQRVIVFLPFTYIMFFPVQVYLGRLVGMEVVKGFFICLGWITVLYFANQKIWEKGIKNYASEGR